ncbi:MAG: Hsp20/alpha crystallin family protein [Gemmataceae bacterium]|nr:Hsp20/alpha crystallin family protein [Gemmataceae bacterium]MDW8266493.1 Hsp20/alpha crystallin family protein [Gemmataceae bacterium]
MFALTPWTRRTTRPLSVFDEPFRWLRSEFEPLFQRLMAPFPTEEWPYRWELTTEEREKEVLVRAELPGFAPEEVKVEVSGDRLTLEAEHKEAKGEKEAGESERVYVKRVISLPPEIDLDKAEATYRHGVLEVRLPRKAEAVGRRIEVKC